jgi:ribonuclease P protein component
VGGAVVRNRARRIMRAAWRAVEPSIAQGVVAVFVARETIRGAKTQDVEAEVRELFRRMGMLSS